MLFARWRVAAPPASISTLANSSSRNTRSSWPSRRISRPTSSSRSPDGISMLPNQRSTSSVASSIRLAFTGRPVGIRLNGRAPIGPAPSAFKLRKNRGTRPADRLRTSTSFSPPRKMRMTSSADSTSANSLTMDDGSLPPVFRRSSPRN